MKRIIIAALFAASLFGVANAQTAPATSTVKKTAKTTMQKTVVTAPKTVTANPTVKTTETKTVTAKSGLKKDGTPDMRMKENKVTKTTTTMTAGPKKKDGTADMRYKANKVKK